MNGILRLFATGLTAVVVALAPASAAAAPAVPLGEVAASRLTASPAHAWVWPVSPPRIVQPFVAPAHAYGPGHRGLDLSAPVGAAVVSREC
ncbi:MAG: hypothetical protein QM622_07595 [Microbacterium sp.]